MKLQMNKTIAATLLAGAGLFASGAASAIVVGGVDFGSPGTQHIETTTLAETLVTASGQTLMGYGQVNTVNGNLLYSGANRLYFTFDNYLSNDFNAGTGTVDFSGGLINVYLGPTFNLLGQSSIANLATIQGYSLWATMAGHADANGDSLKATGILTGAALNFTGAGLLDVTGGLPDVVAFLNSNTIAAFGGNADVSLSTSGNNLVTNANDPACRDANGLFIGQAGQWCVAGSADLRGTTVIPEPSSIALIGLALLGLGVSRKRRAV